MSRSSRSRRTLVLVTAAAALCAGSALAAASGASADAPLVITREAPFLVADASGPVVIADDDFTFDCQHHEIRGNGEPIGLDLTGRRGVTVVNCSWITGFQTGISLVDAAGNTLNGETMGVIAMRSLDNALVGIDMTRATGITIEHVSADNNGEDGIRLSSATGNRFVW